MKKAANMNRWFLIAIVVIVSFALVSATDQPKKGSIIVQPTSGLITNESGGKATFTIKLSQLPLAAVKIGLTCKDTSEGFVSPSSVTFNNTNWNILQTVTVTGVDDLFADGDIAYQVFTDKAISSDPNFSGVQGPNVSLVNWDNEGGPVANPDTATTVEGQPVITNVLANDALNLLANTVTVPTPPVHGTTEVNPDNSITATPTAGYTGIDSYMYQVCDTHDRCSTATVSLTINPVNKAPQAGDDNYSVNQDTILQVPDPGVLGNDSDPNQDPLSAALVQGTGPSHGSLDFQATGAFTYVPNPTFAGEDLFNYQVNDGRATSNIAKVTILVKDTMVPSLDWSSPATNSGVYPVEKDELVSLIVNTSDNVGVARVLYIRWDPLSMKYVDIAEILQQPFSASLDTSQLRYGWNQVFARAYDGAGNPSERQFIWFYKPFRALMPLLQK